MNSVVNVCLRKYSKWNTWSEQSTFTLHPDSGQLVTDLMNGTEKKSGEIVIKWIVIQIRTMRKSRNSFAYLDRILKFMYDSTFLYFCDISRFPFLSPLPWVSLWSVQSRIPWDSYLPLGSWRTNGSNQTGYSRNSNFAGLPFLAPIPASGGKPWEATVTFLTTFSW